MRCADTSRQMRAQILVGICDAQILGVVSRLSAGVQQVY
jgi:hypothetical protein